MNDELAATVQYAGGGGKCHEVIYGRDSVCPWCAAANTAPHGRVEAEVRLPSDARWFRSSSVRVGQGVASSSTLVLLQDVTMFKAQQEELDAMRRLYALMADSPHKCEGWCDAEGRLVSLSPSCEQITGYPAGHIVASPRFMEEIIHKEDLRQWKDFWTFSDAWPGESSVVRLFHKNGHMKWVSLMGQHLRDEDGELLGFRCSLRDITEHKVRELELRQRDFHDSLTGLANKRLCMDRIRQALARAVRREDYAYALILVDIDRFKVVNGSMGHGAGDRCLVEFGQRLLKTVRNLDTVSRFGGDEFAMLLDEIEKPAEAIRVVKRIREALEEPFCIDGQEIKLTASYGLVISPSEDLSADELLQHADIALHRAKESGRNRVKAFTWRMLEQAIDEMSLENDMRRGIARNEFFLQYQPIIAIDGETLTGFEALVRWNHPEKGVLGPDTFIPVAEETGLVIELGRWILGQACTALAEWRETYPGTEHLTVAVNLSGKQFSQTDLVEMVAATLDTHDLPAHCLKLEITETALMDNLATSLGIVKRFRALGVKLSIDDFGTGYCSLAYLQRFVVDTLKVDRSFISRLAQDAENREIVGAVVALAHSLNLDVVAEGVEEGDQLAILRKLRCNNAQGYYFHKPLHMREAESLIRDIGRERQIVEVMA